MQAVPAAPPALLLQTTTALSLGSLLPRLQANLNSSGVWLGETLNTSATSVDLSLELHHNDIHSLYTALVGSGLELSHPAHIALATLCARRAPNSGAVLNIQLEVRLLTSYYHHRFPPRLAISA